MVNSRGPAWGLKQTVESLEAYFVFPRSGEQTQSILQHLATPGARSTPSAILGLAGKGIIIKKKKKKNKESVHNINITITGYIRYGISDMSKTYLQNIIYQIAPILR